LNKTHNTRDLRPIAFTISKNVIKSLPYNSQANSDDSIRDHRIIILLFDSSLKWFPQMFRDIAGLAQHDTSFQRFQDMAVPCAVWNQATTSGLISRK